VEVFIGEVYVPGHTFLPVFTTSAGEVAEQDVRRFTSLLRSVNLKGFYVTDGSNLYHKLYESTVVVD